MDCLVIIDMQPDFDTSNEPWLIERVCERVKEAKRAGLAIIRVEYADQCYGPKFVYRRGETHDEILREIGEYNKVVRIIKNTDDGGEDINKVLQRKKWTGHLYVCGVNVQFCIKETVMTLRGLGYDVSILKDASNGQDYDGSFSIEHSLNYMSRNEIRILNLDTPICLEYN